MRSSGNVRADQACTKCIRDINASVRRWDRSYAFPTEGLGTTWLNQREEDAMSEFYSSTKGTPQVYIAAARSELHAGIRNGYEYVRKNKVATNLRAVGTQTQKLGEIDYQQALLKSERQLQEAHRRISVKVQEQETERNRVVEHKKVAEVSDKEAQEARQVLDKNIAEYTTKRKKAQLEYDTLDAKFKAEQSRAKDYQQALEVSSRELESAVQRNKVKNDELVDEAEIAKATQKALTTELEVERGRAQHYQQMSEMYSAKAAESDLRLVNKEGALQEVLHAMLL